MKLIPYGGDGFGGCPENGSYSVKYGADKEKEFNSFSEAKVFYDALDEEKAFWNNKGLELLDAYILVPDDYEEETPE